MRLYKYMCVFIAIIAFFTGCVNSEIEILTDGTQMINGTESGREGPKQSAGYWKGVIFDEP